MVRRLLRRPGFRGQQRHSQEPAQGLGRPAIDETSFQKRHEYVTVILDSSWDMVKEALAKLILFEKHSASGSGQESSSARHGQILRKAVSEEP